jgi:UDP-glucose 4-epimerase
VRDLTTGITIALTHPAAAGETFHIGPADSYHYDQVVPYLSKVTGRPYVRVNLETTPVYYKTAIVKARQMLGYAPQHTIFDMIDVAQTGID